jgi:NADPH:quinone reductase-like Zn-dependent oxidoreductase
MKAIVYETYGLPDVLRLRELPKPVPAHGEVLVKIHAVSVNSWDWDLLTGRPAAFRIWSGLFRPKHKILGSDIAGSVEAVGENAGRFQPGDAVFGDISMSGWGGFAEYVAVPESVLAPKSDGMSFEQAASIPQAGLLALQGLRKAAIISVPLGINPGHKVLVNGAGGGVGTFAIQIAKLSGAEVTGVDSTAKLEAMRAVGADHVIDYTKQDFTRNGRRYDFILDAVARRSVFDYARALSSNGTFIMVGGSVATILQVLILGPLFGMLGKKKLGILAWSISTDDLDAMRELFDAGKVVPVIDRVYPLGEAAEALRCLGEGRALGKLVISMEEEIRT